MTSPWFQNRLIPRSPLEPKVNNVFPKGKNLQRLKGANEIEWQFLAQ